MCVLILFINFCRVEMDSLQNMCATTIPTLNKNPKHVLVKVYWVKVKKKMVIMSSTKLIREGFNKQKTASYPLFVDTHLTPPPLIHLAKVNKDHQRMMVDPVLMIVQSLR